MALFRFNFKKTHKNQRFDYQPRFWDQKKEDIQARVRHAQNREKDSDPEAIKGRISRGLRRRQPTSSKKRSANKRYNLLLLAIFIALIVITYYVLTVYLPMIEENF